MSIIMSHHFGKPPTMASERDPLDPYNFRGASKFKDDPDILMTVVNANKLMTSHKAWRLKCRLVLRHDESPDDFHLRVNENADLRVKFEQSPVLQVIPPAMGGGITTYI